MEFAIVYLIIMALLAIYVGVLQDKIKKLNRSLECYKQAYFKEQDQSEAYRACLYIAIQDMIDNGWYKKENEAFYMLFSRIHQYKFINALDTTTLIARLLYHKNRIKFSYDYEQELLDKSI